MALSVGSSRIASSGVVDARDAVEEVGQRALLRGQLLSRKEEEVEVERLAAIQVGPRPGDLDHHRDAALHVAGAEALDHAVAQASRDVVLRRNRVEMPGEDDERPVAAALAVPERLAVAPGRLADRALHVGRNLRLVAAL